MRPKQPNPVVDEVEHLTLRKATTKEEASLRSIRRLKDLHEAKWRRSVEQIAVLRRTLNSMKTLHDVGSKLHTHIMPLLAELGPHFATYETDKTIITALLPSTSSVMQKWHILRDEVVALDAALMRRLHQTRAQITTTTKELQNTEKLRDQTANSISSLSADIKSAQTSIKAKKNRIPHPIWRLPVELLLHIFEDCVNNEADGDDLRYLRTFYHTPTMALRLASVCRCWREIMLATPHLWRHLRATRTAQEERNFLNCFERCRGKMIELTMKSGCVPLDLITTATIHRLNLDTENTCDHDWLNLPSPLHLYLHSPDSPIDTVKHVPASLINNTVRLTTWNTTLIFNENNESLKRLELWGWRENVDFTDTLSHLSRLTHLDLLKGETEQMEYLPPITPRSFTHPYLRYLGLSTWCLDALERALEYGLRLPHLLHLGLSQIMSRATEHPFISVQLGARVTQLDFHGEGTATECVRSFVSTFRRTNTIRCYGEATKTVLQAIYEPQTSEVHNHGNDAFVHVENTVHSIPNKLKAVIIRDYKGEGREIYGLLQQIRQYPATDMYPVHITFDNCLNILPSIRGEFAMPASD
jgi:hypothetical protein